ncbi:hypothetical protein ACTL32_13045 [Planococcus sp. FY231025]|uniref:hypothetical protein n=1 Tax=Planococcus sp. FY231025 TaxID=3455699 RepID=UPI003F927C6D
MAKDRDISMEEDIFSIELLHQGKYESWDFKDEAERDAFFSKVKDHFSGHEIREKEEDVDDLRIVQLSATSLQIKSGIADQKVPYEWYDQDSFEDMLGFINKHYDH